MKSLFANSTLHINDMTMDYIRFGSGSKKLVILSGLGDGLKTVKGTALPMSIMYRLFSKEYTVYAFSRSNELKSACSTKDMAAELKLAFDNLGIDRADIIGVSMGGMIAQHFASDYPEAVNKLVLVVTSAKPNSIIDNSVNEWISLAKTGNHSAFMESNLRLIYSDEYYKKNKWTLPIVGKLTKPKSYERFYIMADACLKHNAIDKLPTIQADTLVIGGKKDKCLGVEASYEMADKISNSQLIVYPDLGHGLYEEAKNFQQQILEFLTK